MHVKSSSQRTHAESTLGKGTCGPWCNHGALGVASRALEDLRMRLPLFDVSNSLDPGAFSKLKRLGKMMELAASNLPHFPRLGCSSSHAHDRAPAEFSEVSDAIRSDRSSGKLARDPEDFDPNRWKVDARFEDGSVYLDNNELIAIPDENGLHAIWEALFKQPGKLVAVSRVLDPDRKGQKEHNKMFRKHLPPLLEKATPSFGRSGTRLNLRILHEMSYRLAAK